MASGTPDNTTAWAISSACLLKDENIFVLHDLFI